MNIDITFGLSTLATVCNFQVNKIIEVLKSLTSDVNIKAVPSDMIVICGFRSQVLKVRLSLGSEFSGVRVGVAEDFLVFYVISLSHSIRLFNCSQLLIM